MTMNYNGLVPIKYSLSCVSDKSQSNISTKKSVRIIRQPENNRSNFTLMEYMPSFTQTTPVKFLNTEDGKVVRPISSC